MKTEKELLKQYFEEISLDTGCYCFGPHDTMDALEQGCIQTLLCWQDLEMTRIVLRNPEDDSSSVKYLSEHAEEKGAHLHAADGAQLEVLERCSLVEWLCDHCRESGASLEFVTDRTAEGSQFCRGFGGIGGLLRYKMQFTAEDAHEENWNQSDFDEEDFFV